MDKREYAAIHHWVYKMLGKPSKCEKCGRDGLSGRFIQWANKSRKYLRVECDWMRLCASCHKKYDFTDEMMRNISRLGKVPWNKGLKNPQVYTPERNKKISETLKRIGHNPQKFAKH